MVGVDDVFEAVEDFVEVSGGGDFGGLEEAWGEVEAFEGFLGVCCGLACDACEEGAEGGSWGFESGFWGGGGCLGRGWRGGI